jgi:excinuclease ABC subunit A
VKRRPRHVFRSAPAGRPIADRPIPVRSAAHPLPAQRRRAGRRAMADVRGAAENNLKSIDVRMPLGLAGVPDRRQRIGQIHPGRRDSLQGAQAAAKARRRPPRRASVPSKAPSASAVELVDQRPIGRTPRANVLTYTKALDPIRKLLADTAARAAGGFGPGHFPSTWTAAAARPARAKAMKNGDAVSLRRADLLPRLRGPALQARGAGGRYQGMSIHQILEMTVEQALAFFGDQPASSIPQAPGRRRSGLPAPGTAHFHLFRRRGPAPQAVALPGGRRRDGC